MFNEDTNFTKCDVQRGPPQRKKDRKIRNQRKNKERKEGRNVGVNL